MTADKKLRKIIHSIGLDHNLPDYIVEGVLYSVFKSLSTIISEEGDKSLRLMGWGIFYPRKYKDGWVSLTGTIKSRKINAANRYKKSSSNSESSNPDSKRVQGDLAEGQD